MVQSTSGRRKVEYLMLRIFYALTLVLSTAALKSFPLQFAPNVQKSSSILFTNTISLIRNFENSDDCQFQGLNDGHVANIRVVSYNILPSAVANSLDVSCNDTGLAKDSDDNARYQRAVSEIVSYLNL